MSNVIRIATRNDKPHPETKACNTCKHKGWFRCKATMNFMSYERSWEAMAACGMAGRLWEPKR